LVSDPRPHDDVERPAPDYAKRQALALALLVVVGLAVWGLVSALDGGSHRHATAAAGSAVTHRSLLDALAPDLQQSTGGTLTGAHVALPLGRAVAQLFLVGFAGTDAHAPFVGRLRARDWGGIVLDRGNFTSTSQLRGLVAALRGTAAAAGHTPPLVAVRQEGGDQSALPGLPPAPEPAQGGTPAAVGGQALAAGRALRSLSVNMNLAPDADLGYQGGVGAGRDFSADAASVARLTTAALAGYRRAGVATALGHFPGEGSASQDPVAAPATVGLSLAELQARDLKPFTAAVTATPAMQMSDALFAAIDPAIPAALSPAAYALLRGKLHYAGIIISGDLVAAASDTGVSVGAAAVAALRAGADLLYVPGGAADQEQAYAAVLQGLRSSQIQPTVLAEAAARVLALKRAYGLLGR
jgi:beta-N-acetylhexosaminidase